MAPRVSAPEISFISWMMLNVIYTSASPTSSSLHRWVCHMISKNTPPVLFLLHSLSRYLYSYLIYNSKQITCLFKVWKFVSVFIFIKDWKRFYQSFYYIWIMWYILFFIIWNCILFLTEQNTFIHNKIQMYNKSNFIFY